MILVLLWSTHHTSQYRLADQGGWSLLTRLRSGLCSLQKQLLRGRTCLGQERVSLPDLQLTWDWFLSAFSKEASTPGRLHGLEDSSSSPVGAWETYSNTQIAGYQLTASAVATAFTSGRAEATYKP